MRLRKQPPRREELVKRMLRGGGRRRLRGGGHGVSIINALDTAGRFGHREVSNRFGPSFVGLARPHMQRILINVFRMLALLAIFFCGFVIVSAYKTHAAAKAMLTDFRDLGASTQRSNLESLRRKYGSRLHLVGCDQQYCQYETSLTNSNISALRMVPYTEMKLWFSLGGPYLQWAMLEYRTALSGQNSPVIHVQQGMCAHGCGVRFDVNPHGTTYQMWNGLVEFNTAATPEQREAALSLNLGCFVRIGGCKDITDLLPTMWTHIGPGKISSRLVGLSQRLEESHGAPTQEDY